MSDLNLTADRPQAPPSQRTLPVIPQEPLIVAGVLLPQLVKEMK